MTPTIVRPSWTEEAFERAVRADVFEDGVELIDGDLVAFKVSPQEPAHSQAIQDLLVRLSEQYGVRQVRVQMPLKLGAARPEPDLAVVPPGDYATGHPTTARLIVDVSDTASARGAYDRTRKAVLYGAAGIPEYWIVDVAADTVEICTGPEPDGYAQRVLHAFRAWLAR